jgi:hypothetical protein
VAVSPDCSGWGDTPNLTVPLKLPVGTTRSAKFATPFWPTVAVVGESACSVNPGVAGGGVVLVKFALYVALLPPAAGAVTVRLVDVSPLSQFANVYVEPPALCGFVVTASVCELLGVH